MSLTSSQEESREDRRKRLNRERSQRWRDNHPGAGAAASKKFRDKNGNTPWPAKRALGLEITKLKEETPCADCGGNFPSVCMDFDHVTGVKLYNVATMVAHGHSRDRVMAEIAKCQIVCANCHRIRTSTRSKTSDDGVSVIPEDATSL